MRVEIKNSAQGRKYDLTDVEENDMLEIIQGLNDFSLLKMLLLAMLGGYNIEINNFDDN